MKQNYVCHKCGRIGSSFEDNFHHLSFCKVVPQAIKATESPSHGVTEAEAFGNDCPNNSCS